MPRRQKPEIIHVPFKDGSTFWDIGVCTYPVINPAHLRDWRSDIDASVKKFPEYKDDVRMHMLGGFAAFGNPSSFHNKTIRKLRKHCFEKAKYTVLKSFVEFKNRDLKVECLFDRLMIRRTGQKPDAESFHRDVSMSKNLAPDDYIMGGWINLDDHAQGFRCCPTTHKSITVFEMQEGSKKKKGFAKIPKEKLVEWYPKVKHVVIPPGHAVMFFQHIVHEVYRSPAKYDMYRLFTGYRLTKTEESLFDLTNAFENFAAPLIASGQKPPVYSTNHGSAFLFKKFNAKPNCTYNGGAVEWVKETFVPELLIQKRTGKTSKIPDREYDMIPRYMFPLSELGVFEEICPKYTDDEKEMFAPKSITMLA